jgi:hypothetical protein
MSWHSYTCSPLVIEAVLCIVQVSKCAATLPDRYVLVVCPFLQAVLKEVSDSNGKIVLFIDEIHTVVGAGATGGAMDAGTPGWLHGSMLRCACTVANAQQHIQWVLRMCHVQAKRKESIAAYCSLSCCHMPASIVNTSS